MNQLYVEPGVATLPKHGEELCGDNIEIIRSDSAFVAVLSDGLGSGVKANILSTLTTRIATTMLREGASIDEVVQTVSETLPVCKRRKIAYSTLTIIQIHHNGDTYVAEFDNPSVFHMHQGKIMEIPFFAREVAGKTIREARFTLALDDLLVGISDGVVHAGIGRTLNLGWKRENVAQYLEKRYSSRDSARTMAEWLITVCDHLYGGKPGDDASVVVVKLRTPRQLVIMVGPPSDPDQDQRVVRQLKKTKGRKVVCGGTTSQIVARELNEELQVDLSTLTPHQPPTATIRGIDLATEGILTLTKVLERLRGSPQASEDTLPGATTILYEMLTGSDSITFLVGKAINPAHQNPNLPLSLGLKLKVVDQIQDALRLQGKHVESEFF